MDAKDLRTESAVSERNNDGSKYSQGGGIAVHYDRNKSYQDIGSNSLGKVDVPNARPCAVIGPDRIVPPPATSEAYHLKKGPAEPWPCMDIAYRRPPEYPHKLTNYQNPTRNISPRQTFQENMQRIMVPPTYSSIKVNEEANYAQVSDRSNGITKNIKLNMPPEAKFCDVPFAVNPTNNEHKNVRNPEMCLPSVNSTHARTAPHGWPPGSVNLRSTRMYGGPELYQYQDYPSCAGPRPVVPRPHRTVPEEQGYVYADPFYQEGNLRFKPYPTSKERYPQQRYEYIGNFSNPFHPPPGFPSHKYEVQKTMPPQPYPPYTPIKYLDSRVAEPVMEGYQRNLQGLGPNYNIQYRNQVIHPNYGPVVGSSPQSKIHSYPPDAHLKSLPPNKLPYDSNAKAYIEYENGRPKMYPPSESYFINEMTRLPMKSQVIMPNYSALNMHNMPPNPYYKKDTQHIKNYEHMAHFRNMEPNSNLHNPMSRHAPVFSPNTLAISPTDSNTSNDTTQTLGTSQEDCGYVSQSSTASVRSMDSSINRIPNEYLRKYYENRYGPIVRTSPMMPKSQLNSNNNTSKDKKQIDVRQFLQMWNEGDEEQEENSSKEITVQTGSSDKNNSGKSHSHETINSQQTQEQLYVLGLVNVPSEELAKYEHIQKVSKLPENIKGYNSIELLNQFEEVIESSHMKNYKSPAPKESIYHIPPMKGHPKQATGIIPPRPVSPLDVEAKISQSVIHKDVGCNFEIKPCSPQMLNVDVAAPVQNILAERSIEKVANPVMLRSPMLNSLNENIDCDMMTRTDHRMNINENLRIPSCKMINTQFSNNSIDPMKSSYTIHDLESNSGLCLASLPRLDNDIELNFPEVNQQFINANKGDKTVLANSIRDLPTLEVLDQSPNQIKDKFNHTNPPRPEYNIDKSPYMVDTEKEFSKLSKFRKSKTYDSKETLIPQNVNALRTDSVIIKNPENIKNHEDNSNFSNGLNKVITDIQQAPINLTSQGSFLSDVKNPPDTLDLQVAEKEKQLPVEIAIDFSLNKTGILNSTVYMETKIESQMNTSTHIEGNPLNTFDKHSSSDSVHLLPVFTKENDKLTNVNNKDVNYRFDSVKVSHDISTPIAEINKYNYEVELKKIPASNDSYQNVEGKTNKCVSNSAEEMTADVGSVRSPSPSKMPSDELVSNINSENCEKEISNSEDSTTDELSDDANYTLTEMDSKISSNLTQSLEQKYEMDTAENITKVALDVDFGDSHFVNKLNSPVQSETKTDFNTSDIHNPSEVSDPMVNSQTKPVKKDLLTREETCCKDCDSPGLNTSSESHTILADYTIDHINDNIEGTTSESSEGHSDHEKELKDLEETYCEDSRSTQDNFKGRFCEDTQSSLENFDKTYCADTLSSPENTDVCDIDPSADNDLDYKIEEPIRRNLWYGSKELYSPWIQKLLMFSEGNYNSSNKENHMDNKNFDLADSATTESNNDHDVSNFETRKSDPVKEVTTENNDDYDDSDIEMKNTIPIAEITTENNDDHNNTGFEMRKSVLIAEVNTENNDDHNNIDFEKTKLIPIAEVTTENNGDHNNTDFEMTKLVPVEKETTENNDDRSDTDFKIRQSVPVENVTTENNNDHDDIDFELRKLVPVEKVTTVKNDDYNDSDFKIRKSVPVKNITTENNNHKDINSEMTKSVPVDRITTVKNDDHDESDFYRRKSVSIEEVTSENNDDHEDTDFEMRKSVPLVAENNDHEDTDFEMRKSVPLVADNNDDHEYTDLEMRKSAPIGKVTSENNDDLGDPVLDMNKPVAFQTRTTENNDDTDDSDDFDFELRQSVPQKDDIIENNYDHYDSDFETSKSIPLEKVTTENNYDHDNSNFEIRKSVPLKELSTENNGYQGDSDFGLRKAEELEEVSTESNYGHYDSDFETRKSAPLEEVTTESNDDHGDSGFEPRKAVALEENTTENNYDHYDSDFETRKFTTHRDDGHEDSDFEQKKPVQLIEVTTENNYDQYDSDFETSKSVPLEKVTRENNYGHDDSDFVIRKPVSLEEVTTENNYDHDDFNFEISKSVSLEKVILENNYSDFETRKLVPLEEGSYKSVTEDVIEEQGNSNDTVNETIVCDQVSKCETSVSNSCASNKNLKETVNSDDHFEYGYITIDEAVKHKENEHSVDEVNNVAAAGTPSVTCESNETTTIDPFIEYESSNNENTDINSETQLNSHIETQCGAPDTSNVQVFETQCEAPDTSSNVEVLCESSQEKTELCGNQPEYKVAELESSDHFEHVQFSFNGLQANGGSYKKSQRLKRSLSDSALNMYNNDEQTKQDSEENVQFIWPFKRRKMDTVANDLLAQNLCSIINHNRRNSVSSFYNEDNVSFCILIDNTCIITEEENEETDKVCYTELSEECLAEIQSSCTKHDENMETLTEVVLSPEQENACENSDSCLLDYEEDKTLEESWDEDVGCVETVISDDIAEDIEICGPSPKDDALSDNDESVVFSCNEHTDKVKFIYGDKMCSDDALFVETLYKTPQMDVNKTLYNRETRVSEEYDRYYDNDSLEKMLSESNEPPVSPYVPQYTDTMFTSGKVNSTETPDNKENMDVETYPPFQSKGNALDIVVDINVDKIERESMHSIEIFAKTRDDTTHSCESSVDNVFTYNQKDEDATYTSSSPEVSSTTSEEKNSGILLKITNYQGSRISQINDISRVNKRSSCKFTEEKEYLHTHTNYSSNRPLLTKAAQKYIPPLRESIRDLKVKLTLPQHSLMKLKQLKLSKDEPKVNKQNATIPRIPKKPKPKFEDVLKSIDEIQFKKHKENTKKTKKSIPKVVIKKNRNGSHYASTSNKDNFNPDLTGRKWQPWVFIEKNHFIDKMAIRKKTKAIYSHRKKTYVLAEKFQKYKSASTAKFVITPPISDKSSSGLKYTIRLKHNY